MKNIRRFDPVTGNAIPLADLHRQCFSDPWDFQAIARLAGDPGFALVHGASAQPDSFVLARVAGDEAEILTLATRPDKRRTGLARALLLAASAESIARGATKMFLEVDASNRSAIALYRGLGFAMTGARKGYYRTVGAPPADALILKAVLPLRPPGD